MYNGWEVTALEDLGIVRMRGPDAVRFLQGQLSNDVARLTAERSLLAGYHNPQGRTIALLRLVQWAPDDILAVTARELAASVASRLAKFVLRAKVKIVAESEHWRISGLIGSAQAEPRAVALPSAPHAQAQLDGSVFVRIADAAARWLAVCPADSVAPLPAPGTGRDRAAIDEPPAWVAGDPQRWRRLDVAAGQPQVYAATSGQFVAQMLNLDLLEAIAFDKGCYTGQEVIARAHYRGRVKRRMQRFVSREACRLQPGDAGQLADGRSFKVVLAAQLADGRCDFLAVTARVADEGEPTEAARELPATPAAPDTASSQPTLLADQAALPYSLPE
ncbi:MAG: YgfZ/GcvT domain-containing protein [Steroidobacteraceae bacterium]